MNALAMYYDFKVAYKNKHVRAFGCRDTSHFFVEFFHFFNPIYEFFNKIHEIGNQIILI